MRRSEPWAEAATEGRVVHLVGRVTDEVFGFLGPATRVLAEGGIQQTVVLADDMRFRHLLPRFHDLVDLVLTPVSRNPLRRWQWALEAFEDVLRASPTLAVQLHGVLPCLLGGRAVRRAGIAVPVHYAPRGSASVGSEVGATALLRWIASSGEPQRSALARAMSRAADGARTTRLGGEIVESPVHAEFFRVSRNEARRPLVVTGNQINNPRSAELFAQLAVLLGGEDLGLGFNWIGTADQGSMVRLKAAQVGVFPVKTVTERAARLAAGWIYLAPGGGRGFPALLVEAMAVGLPCVAWDTPYHRDVIQPGETGFLCRSERELVEQIARLIDSPDLRRRIGRAAREAVERRFGEATFRDSLFAAYDIRLPQRDAA